MRDATRIVRAGQPPPAPGTPLHGEVTFASTYYTPGDPAASAYTYGRFHNPTWTAYESALGELEGGTVLAFASGMAAVAAVFGAFVQPGAVVVVPSDSYYTTRVLANGIFAQFGVVVSAAPTAGDAQLALLDTPNVRLLWLETPSNPLLDVCDIARLADAAHQRGVLVAVDNTTATPLAQQPLALGADLVVASDTKGLLGHSDLVLGHVAARDPALLEQVKTWRTQIGAIPGPMEVWLAHRSLSTLYLRQTRQSESALKLAHWLSAQPAVTDVRYPGLPSHPAHALAARQMRLFGSVVCFTLADADTADRLLAACRLIGQATSFGGLLSTAERRARWGGDAVAPGFIRLSVGGEDVDDLIDDLAQALAHR